MIQPNNSAQHLLTAAVPVVHKTITALEVEKMLRSKENIYDTINYVYIVNENKELIGVVSLRELFKMDGNENLEKYTNKHLVTVRSSTDQERLAHLAIKHSIKAVPVLSKDHRFLGVVPSDKILEILNYEHTEDVLRFAGVQHKHAPAVEILFNHSPLSHVRTRLPWLILGLLGGILAAVVIGMFEETLAHELLLAAFIPAIVYMADAVGSQTQMLFVRALAIDHNLHVRSYLLRETIVNSLLGAILASLIFIVSLLWVDSFVISSILGLSIFFTVCSTVMVAIALPWFFHSRGHDPAIASGPLATVLRDILSLLIYLLIASAFLG